MLEDIEVNLLHAAAIFVGLPTLLGFYGSKMAGIYEVRPRHRDSPWCTGSPAAELATPFIESHKTETTLTNSAHKTVLTMRSTS